MSHHLPVALILIPQQVVEEMVLLQLLPIVILVIRVFLEMLQQVDEIAEQFVLVHQRLDDADVVTLGRSRNGALLVNRRHLVVDILKRMAEADRFFQFSLFF